jgi:hypothetical protein
MTMKMKIYGNDGVRYTRSVDIMIVRQSYYARIYDQFYQVWIFTQSLTTGD